MVRKEATVVADCLHAGTDGNEASRLETTVGLRRRDCRASWLNPCFRTQDSRGLEIGRGRLILLRTKERQRLGVVGREPRERLRLPDCTLEPRIARVVRACHGVLAAKRA